MKPGIDLPTFVRITLGIVAAVLLPACGGGSSMGLPGAAGPPGPPGPTTDWSLLGNGGTVDGTNFLGTTDNVALDIRVNGTRALRLEPTAGTSHLIGGWSGNKVTAGVTGATIGGGGATGAVNLVTNDYGTVGGGAGNQAGNGSGVTTSAWYSTVGGGRTNTAGGSYSVVGGGLSNAADGYTAAVSGGTGNNASGSSATVGGGQFNLATASYSTVSGGDANWGTAAYSTVIGGVDNTASASTSTVAGGAYNTANGIGSFAAGVLANAAHDNSFVWSDGSASTTSTGIDQFIARASGGFTLLTNTVSGTGATGATLPSGSSAWAAVSDRNSKDHLVRVKGRETLEKLGKIPVSTWNYKTQDPSVRHIGPMAQDFHAAFQVGEDETHITTLDAEGVAFSAIQGLYEMVKEENAELRAKNAALEARLEALERKLQD